MLLMNFFIMVSSYISSNLENLKYQIISNFLNLSINLKIQCLKKSKKFYVINLTIFKHINLAIVTEIKYKIMQNESYYFIVITYFFKIDKKKKWKISRMMSYI